MGTFEKESRGRVWTFRNSQPCMGTNDTLARSRQATFSSCINPCLQWTSLVNRLLWESPRPSAGSPMTSRGSSRFHALLRCHSRFAVESSLLSGVESGHCVSRKHYLSGEMKIINCVAYYIHTPTAKTYSAAANLSVDAVYNEDDQISRLWAQSSVAHSCHWCDCVECRQCDIVVSYPSRISVLGAGPQSIYRTVNLWSSRGEIRLRARL